MKFLVSWIGIDKFDMILACGMCGRVGYKVTVNWYEHQYCWYV